MPHQNHSGPEGRGPKTGRKLGKCKKTDEELKQTGELGMGQGEQPHSQNPFSKGKGKRINYFKTINNKGE